MDFNELLEPYKEGGRQGRYVERTMDTIIDYLVNKKQFPMEIVGGAVFLVFNWIATGGSFKGDGTYGSPGKELVTSIRLKCVGLQRARQKSATYEVFMDYYAKHMRKYLVPSWKRTLMRWWYGRDIFK